MPTNRQYFASRSLPRGRPTTDSTVYSNNHDCSDPPPHQELGPADPVRTTTPLRCAVFPRVHPATATSRIPMSGQTYGTPVTTQYIPGPVGGPYIVDGRSPSPPRHYHHPFGHHHPFGRHHHFGRRHRHGHHHWFSHHRDRTYSDPEYDYRYRRH